MAMPRKRVPFVHLAELFPLLYLNLSRASSLFVLDGRAASTSGPGAWRPSHHSLLLWRKSTSTTLLRLYIWPVPEVFVRSAALSFGETECRT